MQEPIDKIRLRLKRYGLLSGILILGIGLRLFGLNWDEGQHLHPDERFLTMVMMEMELPSSWSDYFNPAVSLFNPENVGYDFFVYGTAPLVLNKLVAGVLGTDNYHELTLQGRALSALADGTTILIVFLIAKLLMRQYGLNKWLPYWASLIYALAVLPIQLAHFFAVDSFLILFAAMSIWGGLNYTVTGKWKWVGVAGVGLGLGLASKVSALMVLPLLLLLGLSKIIEEFDKKRAGKQLVKEWLSLTGLLLTAYLVLRMADPYMFAEPEVWSLKLSPSLVKNLESLQSFNGDDVWYPPAVQWIGTKPIWFALKNMALLGLGLPIFGWMLVGMGKGMKLMVKKRQWLWGTLLLWWLMFFGYQSVQFVKALRYFSILYPISAVFAGLGVIMMVEKVGKLNIKGRIWGQALAGMGLVIWPMALMSVYIKPHTRVEASRWIYENVPAGSRVVNEHWDDPLPLALPEFAGVRIPGEMIPVFDQDTPAKWRTINTELEKADYYFLSSNRAWGSIRKVPQKYPEMSQFYEKLLEDELEFKKVAEFTSYPSLRYLGVPVDFPDDWADETFTVYDHPKVMVYKRVE